jgi:hypothetical protein
MMISEVGTISEQATIVHSVPGRLRLRVPSLRNIDWRRSELEGLADESEDIEYLAARPAARSLVVEYNPASATADEVVAELSAALGLVVRPLDGTAASNQVDSRRIARGVRELVREANNHVAATTRGVDLRLLVPGTLFVLSVGALLGARRREMPHWHSMLWYAYNLFNHLNPPEAPPTIDRKVN